MQVKKIDVANKLRVPLAQGKFREEDFTISLLVDAQGLVVEFKNGSYLLPMEDLIAEVLKEAIREKVKENK
jgi:hypothetical protein